uniref:Cleavage and polyadenylation specificity factor subunit 4 n=1 Tax=Corvus moneduloides TaxID=1196302 RepID=A0A8U7N7U0_CORMO
MQELVAGVERIRFDSEADVEQQRGARPLPFPGVDSKAVPGVQGRPRHGGAKPAVCKHWLRGLCKRGDGCDFLHDYDATRMPECYFYSKFGECSNQDCPFLHAGATASAVGCPWYDRGFCRHGELGQGWVGRGCPVAIWARGCGESGAPTAPLRGRVLVSVPSAWQVPCASTSTRGG